MQIAFSAAQLLTFSFLFFFFLGRQHIHVDNEKKSVCVHFHAKNRRKKSGFVDCVVNGRAYNLEKLVVGD